MVTNDNLSQNRLLRCSDEMTADWSGNVGRSAMGRSIRARLVVSGE